MTQNLNIPDSEKLLELLRAPGSPGVAMIDPGDGAPPFYVGVIDGVLTKVSPS